MRFTARLFIALLPCCALLAQQPPAATPAPPPAPLPPAAPSVFDTPAPPNFQNGGAGAESFNAGMTEVAPNVSIVRGDPNAKENFDFVDQPILVVFRLLAAKAGMNFIAPALKGDERVTLNLVGLTARDAFNRIASARGFRVVNEGGLTLLERSDSTSPQAYYSRTYTPRFVRVAYLVQAVSNLLGVELAKPAASSPAYPDPQQAGGAATITDSQARSRFTSGLPMDERASRNGEVSIYQVRRTNQIIVRATSSQHEQVQSLLASLDRDLPQIALTCYVMEITESRDNTLGVDWTNALGSNGLRLGLSSGGTDAGGVTPLIKLARAVFYQGSILTASSAEIAIRALQGSRNVRTLSSPNIVAQPGVPAEIAVVEKETVALINTVPGNGVAAVNQSLQTFVTGLNISVIADLLPDGRIGLNLSPSVSSRTGATATAIGNIPTSRERRTNADVVVPDGCAIVLGGILSASDEKGNSEVPFLGRIPVLNALFKNRTVSSSRSNLVIVVTARTLKQPSRQRYGSKEEEFVMDATAGYPQEPAYRPSFQPGMVYPEAAAVPLGDGKAAVPGAAPARTTTTTTTTTTRRAVRP